MIMLKRATARSKASRITKNATTSPTTSSSSPSTPPSNNAPLLFHNDASTTPTIPTTTPDDEIIQRTRLKIPNAHVFKLPPKPTGGGWRGADWSDKIWQGTLKVVERSSSSGGESNGTTAVLLVDADEERNVFAVCPIRHHALNDRNYSRSSNGVDRCVDSSRYFVLRIQNAEGRHTYIGLAFNERNDAFDFNTALEDSRREKEVERRLALLGTNEDDDGGGYKKQVDYTMKVGEKIHVSIPKLGGGGRIGSDDDDDDDDDNQNNSLTNNGGGGDGFGSPQLLSSSSTAASRRRRTTAKKSPTTTTTTTTTSSLSWSLSSIKNGGGTGGGVLKPSSKDTPSRLA